MTTDLETVRDVVTPLLTRLDLDLYDLCLTGPGGKPTLQVLVDREGGVDLDTLGEATRTLSAALDDADPVSGSYLLEVSSPGIERPLRTPAHFRAALGETVTVKHRGADGPDRVRGTLVGADDAGCVVDVDGERRRIDHHDITAARTVFEWGPAPRPGKGSRPGKGAPRRAKENARP